ncbi:hypothetical protein COO60DRAFT_1703584 [Scenedesmus sp. NREL 46B-D3]|nr:hypothetical protein COO60DRAFT_1703584 [Scenedesmus sp. NREL 46B-D3]
MQTAENSSVSAGASADVGAGTATAGAAAVKHQQQQLQRQLVINARQQQTWRWWGLRLHDIEFVASFLQLMGATIFWVPCIFGASRAYLAEGVSNQRTWDGVYWLFQVVGATFFIASSLLFMFEVQPAWSPPKPLLIGWHAGFWNMIGAVGFWLSGFFGFWAVPAAKYQLGGTVLSTFWGSYAFLIGSYLQLLEAVNKHPQHLSRCLRTKH